jgi:hypothetical protein
VHQLHHRALIELIPDALEPLMSQLFGGFHVPP